jgi:uncharacterized protein
MLEWPELARSAKKTFAEYVAHARAAATGRTMNNLFTGDLVAEAGEIKLLGAADDQLA